MNVRITPRGQPQRTDLYGGIDRVESDGVDLWLSGRMDDRRNITRIPLSIVAEIALDDEPGMWW